MYIFKKPITILYVLFSIVVLSLAFQNCSSPFESVSSGGSFGAGPDNLSVNEVKSVEIYEKTLYNNIQQNCASCHGTVQRPLFAVDNSLDSHRLIFQKEFVNLENPENSYFAIKIRAGHNKFPVEMADEFVASISQWSNDLKLAIEVPEDGQPQPVEEQPEEEKPEEEAPEEEKSEEEEPEEEEPPVNTATFSKVNSTILAPKCVSCHRPAADGGFGLRDDYSDYDSTINTGSVVPGDSAASKMYDEIVSGKMPPAKALSDEEIELVKMWIDAGAKND